MRILIAEDDATSRAILSAILDKWGYDPVVACDGESALQALASEDAPKLLLLDRNMPGVDGLEVCRRLRRIDTPDPPYIIILTAQGGKYEVVQGLEAGANDYITKPYHSSELKARLDVGRKLLQLQAGLLEARDALEYEAMHDALTGVFNRRAIFARLSQEIARANRFGGSFSIGLFDLDHFKRVNDTHGHAAGDQVLLAVARYLQANLREYDCLGRYGGEEFLLIAPGADGSEDASLFDRLREGLARQAILLPGGPLAITASVGVAAWWGRGDAETLFAEADAALYCAKADGRNRVVTAMRHLRAAARDSG